MDVSCILCFLFPHIHLVTSPLKVPAKWRPFKENLKVYWTNLLSVTFLRTVQIVFGNVSLCAALNSSPSLLASSALLCSSFNVKMASTCDQTVATTASRTRLFSGSQARSRFLYSFYVFLRQLGDVAFWFHHNQKHTGQ